MKYSRQRDQRQAFLVAQIQILKRRLGKKHFKPSPEERSLLLAIGGRCDHNVDACLEIVTPQTYRRWLREQAAGKVAGQVGRKRICQSITEVVLRMARENLAWGYFRLAGELKKLDIRLSPAGVKSVLVMNGIHPTKGGSTRWNPPRTWQTFIDSHMESLLGCDLFCKKVLTWRGWVDAFVFFVIHLGSRRVYLSPPTFNPTGDWLAQQMRNVSMWCEDEGIEPRYLIRDNDSKFSGYFDRTVESLGIEVNRTSLLAPNMNPFSEVFVRNTKIECLGHFIIFSMPQLDRMLRAWRDYYNHERPHRGLGIGNTVLDKSFRPVGEGEIVCQRTLGGLLKSYHRGAA